MKKQIKYASGEYYHLYNRGTEGRDIFLDKSDYQRFLTILYFFNQKNNVCLELENLTSEKIGMQKRTEKLVDIAAYCLMPNHYHLLLQEKENGGISKFMQKIGGYTMYFNERYGRTGALFQGRYKAKHIDSDAYLRYLISYIHLNPIKIIEPTWKKTGIQNKEMAEKYLERFSYSSYLDYRNIRRKESAILSLETIPEYFLRGTDFKNFVTEWLC